MMLYYQELIRIRQTYSIFRTNNTAIAANTSLGDGKVDITIDNHQGGKARVIANPTGEAMTYSVSGDWYMVVNGVSVMASPEAVNGTITIPAYAAVVLLNANSLQAGA